MNKKIIITEEQYKKIKFHLLESTFDKMAKNLITKGDIITIKSKGKDFNFKVLDNYGGRIYMDNVDDGTRIFITNNSFQDNNLEINIAQNDEQKNQNPPKGETWGKMTFKNVEEINVTRDGKLIDGTELDPKELAKNENKRQEKVKDFIDTLLEIKEGEKLTIDTETLILELIYKKQEGDKLFFSLSEDNKSEIDKDDNIEFISIILDEKEIKIDTEGKINLTLNEINKDKTTKKSDIKIDEWSIDVIDSDDIPKDSKEETPDEETQEEEPEEDKDFDKDTFIKMLTGDAQLRTAYYKNPSKWKSFFGELTGKKQKGTGYTAIQDILRTYSERKVSEKLGESFLKKGDISFEPVENIEVLYNEGDGNEYFTLNSGKVYNDEFSVKRMGVDGGEEDKEFEYNLRLANRKYNFEIIVTDTTEDPNVYICDVKKLYYTDKTEKNPKGVLTRSKPFEDAKIKFLESPGYKTKKVEPKK